MRLLRLLIIELGCLSRSPEFTADLRETAVRQSAPISGESASLPNQVDWS